MKQIAKIIPALFLLMFTSCQDHHFVTMDKAEKIKFPTQKKDSKSFDNSEAGKKYVMTDEYRQNGSSKKIKPATKKGEGRLIAEGLLELDGKIAGQDFSAYTVYIIVWNDNQPGPPTAVIKKSGASFPISFRITEKNLMAGGFPAEGDPLRLEARLDGDGDVMSKVSGDYYGITTTALTTGVKAVRLTINKAR